MTQQDFSSPDHRLDNLINMRFVRAYARLRHHVHNDGLDDDTAHWMRGYMGTLEENMAEEMCLPLTSLVGRLVDLGRDLCTTKGAKDRAE